MHWAHVFFNAAIGGGVRSSSRSWPSTCAIKKSFDRQASQPTDITPYLYYVALIML